MSKDKHFSAIRPYNDNEIQAVFKSLLKEDSFKELLSHIFPKISIDNFQKLLSSIETVKDFQTKIVYPYVNEIVSNTTNGVSYSGLENLDPKKGYLFISNHRDIVLDPTLLNKILIENEFETVEIAIGDNLLIYPWITEVVKLNRSFLVQRNLPVRQQLMSSKLLSEYIRYSRTENNNNIWIAQREGRSKDGDDRTQTSLLKMINMSGSGSFEENFKEMQIVPLAISYEYDPCDNLKAKEFYNKSQDSNFKKTPQDDLVHMQTGIVGKKGRIHYAFGTPINGELEQFQNMDKQNQLQELANAIDVQIHNNYKLWPGNFVASDLYNDCSKLTGEYSNKDSETFIQYMNEQISKVEGDKSFLKNAMLEMYSNPVKNCYNK